MKGTKTPLPYFEFKFSDLDYPKNEGEQNIYKFPKLMSSKFVNKKILILIKSYKALFISYSNKKHTKNFFKSINYVLNTCYNSFVIQELHNKK